MYAVDRARIILSMQERNDGFNAPPPRLWLDDKKLAEYVNTENKRVDTARASGKPDWDPQAVEGDVETQDVDGIFLPDDAPVPA